MELAPWEEERRTRRIIRRMMSRMWEPFSRPFTPEFWKEFREEMKYDSFPIDLNETDGELILNADLPGFEKCDLKINVTDDSIEIFAQKKGEKKEITKTTYRRERSMGALRRSMNLPVIVDPENVVAEFKNGVLTVTMKKKKVKKGKEIKIE
jgi:HSP20 family protein